MLEVCRESMRMDLYREFMLRREECRRCVGSLCVGRSVGGV